MPKYFLTDPDMFQGKVVVITGASRGIGRSIAEAFAEAGAKLALNYRCMEGDVDETAALARKNGAEVMVIRCDVSDYQQVRNMVQQVISAWGKIDILVNNAGITQPKFFMDITEDEWDVMMDINLKGLYNCCHHVIPYMMEQKHGKIINMSSAVAKSGAIGAGAHYCAAKAGVIGLTKALANQLADYNIHVNAVAPAMIDTDMIRWRSPELLQEHLAMIPLKRLGEPREVSGAVLFLASEYADYITGYTVDINGGMYMD